ncbi:HAMP domain-containing histidine kinase [Candidatus Gracilibacteria bacterium 28_42_T64]|nr:HAMP domain-containing histidine kinase [Candidatus Gracilibacteria bacterium 28_42_T64]
MKNEQRLALQITFFVFLLFTVYGSIFLFIFSDSVSIKDIYLKLFEEKIIFGKNVFYFYTYVGIKCISILFGIYFISYFFTKKLFTGIERHNKKLREYNHNLAHELKTPISVIHSNLDILKFGFNKEKISSSQDELKNMIKIIDGLLDFSNSLHISSKKNINLENFIQQSTYFVKEKSNIKIINKEFNLSIYTDEVLFLRVIKNLIENALKYSLDGKLLIYINTDKLIFQNKIERNISQKDLKNMTNKFYSQSPEQSKGYGLGLPMIEEIIKTLGYTMNIKSEDKKFTVEILY